VGNCSTRDPRGPISGKLKNIPFDSFAFDKPWAAVLIIAKNLVAKTSQVAHSVATPLLALFR